MKKQIQKIKQNSIIRHIFNQKVNIGLTINIIGTLMIAYSLGSANYGGFGGGYRCTSSPTGWCEFVYFLYPQMFNIGIWLLVLGFILQIQRK